jgi:hypothetical protein
MADPNSSTEYMQTIKSIKEKADIFPKSGTMDELITYLLKFGYTSELILDALDKRTPIKKSFSSDFFVDYKPKKSEPFIHPDLLKSNFKSASQPVVVTDEILCCICLERKKDTVILICKHMQTCYQCSVPLKECPICRVAIDSEADLMKVFA